MNASVSSPKVLARPSASLPGLFLADCVDWLRGFTRQLGGRGAAPGVHPETHFSDCLHFPAPQSRYRTRMSRPERRTYYALRATREEIAEILRAHTEPRFFRRRRTRHRF